MEWPFSQEKTQRLQAMKGLTWYDMTLPELAEYYVYVTLTHGDQDIEAKSILDELERRDDMLEDFIHTEDSEED